jgi:hypothetical protein
MSNILAQYYRGITHQLRSEVDFINTLFQHQGVKGEGNETVLRDLLTRFIPRRYGVGTGVVIDRYGTQSRQIDIVIYDTLMYPSLLSLTSVHLFPVDIVYATIEVKTTLTSASARESIENLASVKRLKIIEDQFMLAEPQGGGISYINYSPRPPLGFVFSYNSDALQFETFKDWYTPNSQYPPALLPNLVGCLDQGFVLFADLSPAIEDRPQGHAIPVAVPDTDGNVGLLQPLDVSAKIESITNEGVNYPVKKVKDGNLAMD